MSFTILSHVHEKKSSDCVEVHFWCNRAEDWFVNCWISKKIHTKLSGNYLHCTNIWVFILWPTVFGLSCRPFVCFVPSRSMLSANFFCVFQFVCAFLGSFDESSPMANKSFFCLFDFIQWNVVEHSQCSLELASLSLALATLVSNSIVKKFFDGRWLILFSLKKWEQNNYNKNEFPYDLIISLR